MLNTPLLTIVGTIDDYFKSPIALKAYAELLVKHPTTEYQASIVVANLTSIAITAHTWVECKYTCVMWS